MRLQIKNRSGVPDVEIEALTRYAASFFPTVTGKISVHVTKSQRLFGGCCYFGRQRIDIRCRFTNEGLPWTRKGQMLGYFPQHQIPLAAPMPECKTWRDIFVMVAAHEFAHCTGPGEKWRKSRREVYCEKRAAEVLAAFQTPEGRYEARRIEAEMIDASIQCAVKQKQQRAVVNSPDSKIAHLAALQAKWMRKAKLAATKIRKLKTRIKYWERKATLAIAATHNEKE